TGSSKAVPGAFIDRSDAMNAGGEQSLADQPVGLVGALPARILLDERAEHVGNRFVQRAGLAEIDKVRLVAGHPVRELVRDDIERDREAVEKITVTVAEHHLPAVPERVIVAAPIMHARVETQP